MQLVLLAAGENVAATVAHKPVAATVFDRTCVVQQVPRAVERLTAVQANGARVPVRGLAVRAQRARLHKRFRAELAAQRRGRRVRPRAVRRGHVRGQRFSAAARHAARSAPVPQVSIDVQLTVPAVRERFFAVVASVMVLGHSGGGGGNEPD